MQENATTGGRPKRKCTPANIQKIKGWVAKEFHEKKLLNRFT
jgi:hypothetical protein